MFDFLWIYNWCEKKIIKKEACLPRAKESNFLLRSLDWHGINFLCFLCCLDQNEFRIFFSSLTRSWSWAWQYLLLLVCSSQFMTVCLILPFCSYRTRCWIILNAAAVANSGWWPSLKRRRTTKIRRLIVAWDCRVPSLLIHHVSLSHQRGHTTTCSLSVCFLSCSLLLLFQVHLHFLGGLFCLFHMAK